MKHLDYNRHEVCLELQQQPDLKLLENDYEHKDYPVKTVTTIYFGAKSELWDGVRSLADFGYALKARFYSDIDPSNLFTINLDAKCIIELKGHSGTHGYNTKVKTDPSIPVSYGEFLEYISQFNNESYHPRTEFMKIHNPLLEFALKNNVKELVSLGASHYERHHFLHPTHRVSLDINIRYYVASFHHDDVIYSLVSDRNSPVLEIKKNPEDAIDHLPIMQVLKREGIDFENTTRSKGIRLAEYARKPHVFIEPELEERAYDDWTITEREIKLDAKHDPREILNRLSLGDNIEVFSGKPMVNVNYQKVYNIGPSGIIYMSNDLKGDMPMLKYKFFVGNDDQGALVRKEIVVPYSEETLTDIAHELDPRATLSTTVVTPFFCRDRIRVNVYMAESRNVFEVYADHSSFVKGDYRDFNQVEIEYAGIICEEGSLRPEQSVLVKSINDDFKKLRKIVLEVFELNGTPLSSSTRSKFDWANAEVFAKKE